jgi:hypothetical protein
VERVAAGAAPSSPQPPEAGALRVRLYGVLSVAENGTDRHCRRAGACRRANAAAGFGSADFEHVADLPLAARRLPAASLGAFELPLANVREDGAEVVGHAWGWSSRFSITARRESISSTAAPRLPNEQ